MSFIIKFFIYNILETKNFILNHADIDDKYKLRMKKFYLSPEEIMNIVAENDTES